MEHRRGGQIEGELQESNTCKVLVHVVIAEVG
jgi:hypothetical protein